MVPAAGAYEALRKSIELGDIVVSSHPLKTNYFLGQVDGHLWRKRLSSGALSAVEYQTEEYFGIPIIDTIDELQELWRSQKRVWVITSPGSSRMSLEMWEFLGNKFHLDFQGELVLVYVNHPDLSIRN